MDNNFRLLTSVYILFIFAVLDYIIYQYKQKKWSKDFKMKSIYGIISEPELPTGHFFSAWPGLRPGSTQVASPAKKSKSVLHLTGSTNQANWCFWFFEPINFYNSLLMYSVVPISIIYFFYFHEDNRITNFCRK